MTERSDDAARLMRTLWRGMIDTPPQRGRRPTVTVDALLAVAIAIADRDGIDAVTIRRLAEALDVSTMSVYTYLGGKDDLLPLMADAVHLAMERPPLPPGDWRGAITMVAAGNRRLVERHPWVTRVPPGRPTLGPGTIAKYDYELGALDGLGLSDIDIDAALAFVLDFVAAWVARRQDEPGGDTDDEAWWDAHAPFLALAMDGTRYPRATRVGVSVGEAIGAAHDPEHAWNFGLSRIIDGLAAMIEAG